MNEPPRNLPERLCVIPLIDPEVERYGHAPLSPYIESCWTPVLGPSAVLLYRRIGTWVATGALEVDPIDLSLSLGLGEGIGYHSRLAKAIGRLTNYRAAEWQDTELAVRRALPRVPPKLMGKLSLSALQVHEQVINRR